MWICLFDFFCYGIVFVVFWLEFIMDLVIKFLGCGGGLEVEEGGGDDG